MEIFISLEVHLFGRIMFILLIDMTWIPTHCEWRSVISLGRSFSFITLHIFEKKMKITEPCSLNSHVNLLYMLNINKLLVSLRQKLFLWFFFTYSASNVLREAFLSWFKSVAIVFCVLQKKPIPFNSLFSLKFENFLFNLSDLPGSQFLFDVFFFVRF